MALTNEQKAAREQARQAKWEFQRGGIPNNYPTWDEAAGAHHLLALDGYAPLDSPELFAGVREVLEEEPMIRRIFLRIGAVLGCYPEAVCLVSPMESLTRGGAAAGSGIAFRFPYNKAAATVLKGAGHAIYSKTPSRWTLPIGTNDTGALTDLRQHFHALIDLTTMAIMVSEKAPAGVGIPVEDHQFCLAEKPIEVTVPDIEAALREGRPQDHPVMDQLFIHTGEQFIAFPKSNIALTQATSILLRYPVPAGQPRYALYDTRRSVVIQFAFSNVSRLTRQLIARYADTFEHYRYTGDLLEKSVFSAGGFN